MKVTLLSIIVADQDRAVAMYRDTLGFVLKDDLPTGPPGAPRWITLESPEVPGGTRISLEPNAFPFVAEYQKALKDNGVPLTAFAVADIDAEHARLTEAGVAFKSPPSAGSDGAPRMAVFDDQCGNWIMLYEEKADG
jgi:catechol 2,3-dioxygenase-like lactoylglutathione lyase family enzyme